MAKRTKFENRIELVQGTLDMLILRTLQWGPQHGHGIKVAIRASSDEALQIDHGSLYPALHRLERQGWIDADWKMSDKNQRAKYYRLTPAGKRQLAAEQSRWNQIVEVIARVMKGGALNKSKA
jgi:PadR family transcriptional regulator PadR